MVPDVRSLARNFFSSQHPSVISTLPTVTVNEFSGLDELFRSVLSGIRPSMTAREFITRNTTFEASDRNNKIRQISQLLNSLLSSNEATFIIDDGGVLDDAGALQSEIDDIVSNLETRPHPPVIFIAPRMIPEKHRRREKDISYLSLRSLRPEYSKRLMQRLLRDKDISVATDQLDNLVDLTDGHPFNFYKIIEEVSALGTDAFLADSAGFIDWKHRQSSQYISRINLSDQDIVILGVLNIVPEVDFGAICDATSIKASEVSEALSKLSDLHVVEAKNATFKISPALRIAVERDKRIGLLGPSRARAVEAIAASLSVRLEEGTASIVLANAAVISALETGKTLPQIINALLLPSHYVWLSKRKYDERAFEECIRLATEALKGRARLSTGGTIAACRFKCLAAARTGRSGDFKDGMEILQSVAVSDFARSNVYFLIGFEARLNGRLPIAEDNFRKSFDLSPGNTSASRELAAVCLARGNLDEAERYARVAYSQAPTNPYFLDILISTLIRKYGNKIEYRVDIERLFDDLEAVGDEDGRSFYTTRKAEFELLWGDKMEALRLIDEAILKTPHIFEARRIRAKIKIKVRDFNGANSDIRWMNDRVYKNDNFERRTNYRDFIEVKAEYLTEVGEFGEAKSIYDDRNVFSNEERLEAVRLIEIAQAYKRKP